MILTIRKRIRHVDAFGCDVLEVDKGTVELQHLARWFDIPGVDYTVEWFLDPDGLYLVEGPCRPPRGVQHRHTHAWIPLCFAPEEWGSKYVSRRVVEGGE